MSVFVCKRHFWWRHIWRHLHVTMLQRWDKFSNGLVPWTEVSGWFVPKIMKFRLNLSNLCQEYSGIQATSGLKVVQNNVFYYIHLATKCHCILHCRVYNISCSVKRSVNSDGITKYKPRFCSQLLWYRRRETSWFCLTRAWCAVCRGVQYKCSKKTSVKLLWFWLTAMSN